MAGISKITIIDSPEKMRARNRGCSIVIPHVRSETQEKKDTKTEETSKTK